MNKKAGLTMTIKAIVGILLGLIVLFALVLPVTKTIWEMFFPDTSQLTKESFSVLEQTIDTVRLNQTDSALVYLKKGEALVAFDNAPNKGSGTTGYYDRPEGCYNKACLVVCRDNRNSNACLNSDLLAGYDFFDFFETSEPMSGIITLGKGEYVSLDIELVSGSTIRIVEKVI